MSEVSYEIYWHMMDDSKPPNDREGEYIVVLSDGKSHVMRVSKITVGYLATIGNLFAWDILTGDRKIVAWAEISRMTSFIKECIPKEE